MKQFAFAAKHKLTLHFEQVTRVTLLHPGNLNRPGFPSHVYEGQCANESKRIDLCGIGAAGPRFFFFADKSFSNQEFDGRPGVLSLWLLSFINREFAMLILNDLKAIHFISGILKNFKSGQYNNHDCTTAMSKK